MLKKRIIPCLDVKNGKVVKGVNFVELRDAGDPVELAEFYYKQGADELCFLDIGATLEKRKTICDIVKKVANHIFIPLTVGGGISTLDDIKHLMHSGADKVSINSAAIKNPDLITEGAEKFGSQAIVVAIDAKKNEQGEYKIYTHGGTKETDLFALDWAIEAAKRGAGELLVTSMDKDGTKTGFNHELNKMISDKTNIPIIASGGVGKLEHFAEGIEKGGVDAVLAASVFHFGELTIGEVKEDLRKRNIAVRI